MHDGKPCTTCSKLLYCTINKGACRCLTKILNVEKFNEAAIRMNEQTVGLKVVIFRLHYITKYFLDFKFLNNESVPTQTFAFSRLKKKTPKSSS